MKDETIITTEIIEAMKSANEIIFKAHDNGGKIILTKFGRGIWTSQQAELFCQAQIRKSCHDNPTLAPTEAEYSICAGLEMETFQNIIDLLKPNDTIQIIFLSNHTIPIKMMEDGINLDSLYLRIYRKTGKKSPVVTDKTFLIASSVSDKNWRRMIHKWQLIIEDNEPSIIENDDESLAISNDHAKDTTEE